jgi:hypothetical protein
MGRIRTIKPEFHAHEELSALPAETHLLAGALTNYADDEGYFNANPGLVKAATHPLRNKDKTPIEEQLSQLEKMKYICIRRCADGKSIGFIVNFQLHQKVSHPSPSKLRERFESAEIEDSRNIPEASLTPLETLPPEQGTGNRELNRGTGNGEALTADAVPASPAVETFCLTNGKTHIVTESDVASYQRAYPAVDILHELRKALVWLDAHPEKRSSTVNGSKQRIVRWLTRTQDDGGSRGTAKSQATLGMSNAGHMSDEVIEQVRASMEAKRKAKTI